MISPTRAAIVGVGMEITDGGPARAESVLAKSALVRALEDAGLGLPDVDGYITYGMDSNDPLTTSRTLGLGPLTWWSTTPFGGGGACATIQDAALAVTTGIADVVVAVRAGNMRSGIRYGQVDESQHSRPNRRYSAPWGVLTPAHSASLWFHRYLHELGLTNADLAPVTVAARDFAATNPAARFHGRPITIDDHQASPWVVEPALRRLDCCLESDGAAAIVVTSESRARDLASTPVVVTAAARGMAARSSILENYHGEATRLPDLDVVAEQLWRRSGLTPADISTAIFYDAFSPLVLLCLETFGFCDRGDAAGLVAEGHIGRGGKLPVNPNGGQLGEAYLHGFNGIVEAVRQLRGTAANQVAGAEHALATGGPALPTSGLILSKAA